MFNEALIKKAEQVINLCKAKKLMITTAESCTGGLIAGLFTEISGSSSVFERGFVSYSNQAKHELLGVSNITLDEYGAVSSKTAKEMALGAIKNSHAQISIAVTGVAGPTGGTIEKPIGLVYIAIFINNEIIIKKCNFSGNRNEIRFMTINCALDILLEQL